ncbi:MAG: hypothetical protein KFB93_01585 [Simkaniaceae bacterium]|nr:MAG: hypothetical protein KFB93_01585 [Simkaniaceae bacterium]
MIKEKTSDYPEFYCDLFEKGSQAFATNVKTELKLLEIDNLCLPLTVNDSEWENSYVVSPYAIIPYIEEEMKRHGFKFLKLFFSPILGFAKWLLKTCRVNRVVMVNNHLLSTNLYPDLSNEQVKKIHAYLLEKFSDHAIIFRSLNPYSEKGLMDSLRANNYHFMTNRSIYFYSHKESLTNGKIRRRIKKDGDLLQQDGIEVMAHEEFSIEDASEVKRLYDLLYLEKYSYQNPQFTEEFFKTAILRKTFTLIGIRFNGKLIGVIGYFKKNGVMTFPIVGYEISFPQSLGLYRMLTFLMLEEASKLDHIIHMSSGVGEFKRGRGGVQEIESMAIFLKHLSFYRRIPWNIFSFLLNTFGKKIALRRKL